jgi:cysteine desulfurase
MQVTTGTPTTQRPVYLDCAATTPVDPEVLEVVLRYIVDDFGNAGSRTHAYGADANVAVEQARRQVAAVAGAEADEVTFTSGATEANNLALLGLADFGAAEGRRHIIATQIEHKAVLEPLAVLARRGFDIELVPPQPNGAIDPEDLVARVRDDTLVVSVMQVNNETGIIQPIAEVAAGLGARPAFLHVDAAQGFGKELDAPRHRRVDLVSLSGHKLFAPKGIGALIARRRGRNRPPLQPLVHGGGQERGLRAGTLPVHLIAGLGQAAELAAARHQERRARCVELRAALLDALGGIDHRISGDPDLSVPHILNVSFRGLDTEAIILILRDLVAISNGSACTSAQYEPSHVLRAMAADEDQLNGAVRLSWSHLTPDPPAVDAVTAIRSLL